MRYLALVVGIAMIAIGLLAEVGSILFFSGLGLGSFECSGPGCDFLGPWPFFMGGGIVLIVIGFFVTTIASSAIAVRNSAGSAARWARIARMNRFGPYAGRGTSGLPTVSALTDDQRGTSWNVTTSANSIDPMVPAEFAPMVEGILSGLRASGLIPPDSGHVRVIDSTTGLPIPAYRPADTRTEAERARDLRATGTLGRVTVHGFRELPAAAQGGQLFELQLEVTPDGKPPYRLRHFALVPARWRHLLVTGAGFPVWIDADDPSRLLIEWEQG